MPVNDVVSGGTWHSIAVTEGGQVYAWGRGNYGQLGIDQGLIPKEGLTKPTLVEAMQGIHVKGVTAAAAHTIALGVDDS